MFLVLNFRNFLYNKSFWIYGTFKGRVCVWLPRQMVTASPLLFGSLQLYISKSLLCCVAFEVRNIFCPCDVYGVAGHVTTIIQELFVVVLP